MIALLVGPLSTKSELSAFLKKQPKLKKTIVAVDAGLHLCEQLKLTPLFSVGDFDSYHERGKKILKLRLDHVWTLPKNKDRSDLAYALKLVLTQSFLGCIAIGFQGGRLDHEIGTHLDFSEASREYLTIQSLGKRGEIFYLHTKSDLKLKLKKGVTLSLFPIENETAKVKCFGFKYGSFKKAFSITRTNGLSNEVTHEFQKIWCVKGPIMVMIPEMNSKGKF